MLKKRIQHGTEIEILKVCNLGLKGKICTSASSAMLTLPFEKNAQLRDDYLKLKRTWKQESGKRAVLMWLFMKPIENSNVRDWSCTRRINGQIRLKEKRSTYLENWK